MRGERNIDPNRNRRPSRKPKEEYEAEEDENAGTD